MRSLILATALILVSGAVHAESMIYPSKGQSPQQVTQDKAECNSWARQEASQTTPSQRPGGALRGAARGATVGALADKDVGDTAAAGAAVGVMRRRDAARTQPSDTDRAFAACMEGRGYSVK